MYLTHQQQGRCADSVTATLLLLKKKLGEFRPGNAVFLCSIFFSFLSLEYVWLALWPGIQESSFHVFTEYGSCVYWIHIRNEDADILACLVLCTGGYCAPSMFCIIVVKFKYNQGDLLFIVKTHTVLLYHKALHILFLPHPFWRKSRCVLLSNVHNYYEKNHI